MSWRLSGALIRLQGEVNDRHPGRAKQSDGTIGDPAHAARKSDHNPNADGIVMAWDVTGGPNGAAQSVVDHLERTRDPRIKYVIWQRRIMAGNAGPAPWTWRPYKGANPHDKHAHISVNSDDASPWGYGEAQTPPPIPKDDDMTPDEIRQIIREEVGRAIGWTRAVAEDPKLADTSPDSKRLADRAGHLNPERKS